MNYLKSTGKIIYDPYRGQMKHRTKGWCIINVDTEITRYYRWWLKYQYHINLQPPSWDAHISIVRGEVFKNGKIKQDIKSVWNKYQGNIVTFEYQHGNIQVYRSGRNDREGDGDYYVIDVKCPFINTIREELGLWLPDTHHLTIGRTYEYQARVPKRFQKEKK